MGDVQELAAEQRHVDRAYERLAVRQRSAEQMEIPGGESAGEIFHRDELAAIRARRISALHIGDLPLCFGRIDTDEGEAWHVGRFGVADEDGDQLVVDWRAPVAAAFYRATPGEPLGVVRRRHLRCSAATVLGLDDEALTEGRDGDGLVLVGEAALLRAMERHRTGRMSDIVATIQNEQDVVIRAPLEEPLVVQGGPGTGKTAVALHRLAYLLYTHRELFEAKGVLLIGPTTTFLRYIERVLPSLGEQGATLATIATIGRPASAAALRVDAPQVLQLKGDLRMATVVARAVDGRQRPLTKAADIPFGAYRLRFAVRASETIVAHVRGLPGNHNERRPALERHVLAHLHRAYVASVERAQRVGRQAAPPMPLQEFVDAVRRVQETRQLLDRLWPVLSAERLLEDLLGHAPLIRAASDGILDDDEQRWLVRDRNDLKGWSEGDVPLLDEAAVHLGSVPETPRKATVSEDLEWMADRVLAGVAADADISMSRSIAAEIRDRIVREEVATEPVNLRPKVAASFAHVVVDEAQDLSPMAWRMVARRCPSGSVTLVGDIGQASGGWRLGWDAVLDLAAPSRDGSIVELTMNYRTPREVMDLAAQVLRVASPQLLPPTSVRANGRPPSILEVDVEHLAAATVGVARRARESATGGTAAVIAIDARHPELRAELDAHGATRRTGREALDDPVALLSPGQAKGLEFDLVIVVEPAEIAPSNDRLLALYVALTRTTDQLAIVHAKPLPACLAAGIMTAAAVGA